MSEEKKGFGPRSVCGVALVALGVVVFAIRLQHDGAYAMPRGGNLFGGLGSLALGGALLWRDLPRIGFWIVVALTPLVLFRGVYAVMAEAEEVISLYATDSGGAPAELRLWISDRDDGSWLGMPRSKAAEHALHGKPHQMLRDGETICVVPIVVEERDTVVAMHEEKLEKYAVARFSASLGIYPSVAPETTVAVRLDPCP